MNYKSFNLGDWIGHISGVIEDETTLDGNEMRDLVEFLSTLEQEPRKGYWLRRPHVYGVTYCSICDFELKIDNTNYCPNCGAKMVEPQESEKTDG